MATEAVGAGLHRPAEADQFDCCDPVGGEEFESRDASGDLSRGWAHAGWRDQAVSAGSLFPGDQGAGRYCAGGAGRHLRTAADEYLPHQMPAARDARGRADLDYRADDAGYGSGVGEGEEGDGRFVLRANHALDLNLAYALGRLSGRSFATPGKNGSAQDDTHREIVKLHHH